MKAQMRASAENQLSSCGVAFIVVGLRHCELWSNVDVMQKNCVMSRFGDLGNVQRLTRALETRRQLYLEPEFKQRPDRPG